MRARPCRTRQSPVTREAQDAAAERADAARNRARLLAAAALLVAGRGAGHVTMDEVARVAGVGKGTLFRRFGDRNGLLLALLDDVEGEFRGPRRQAGRRCARRRRVHRAWPPPHQRIEGSCPHPLVTPEGHGRLHGSATHGAREARRCADRLRVGQASSPKRGA